MTLSLLKMEGLKEAGITIDEEKLGEIKLAISKMERSAMMSGAAREAEEVQPIRRVLDIIEKDLAYSHELERTLRDNLSPVLRQQPKVEKAGVVDESITASSSIFNDLDNLSRQIKSHNAGLLDIIEDLEI